MRRARTPAPTRRSPTPVRGGADDRIAGTLVDGTFYGAMNSVASGTIYLRRRDGAEGEAFVVQNPPMPEEFYRVLSNHELAQTEGSEGPFWITTAAGDLTSGAGTYLWTMQAVE